MAEDQRNHLDADLEPGGLKEGLGAEGGVVGKDGVFSDEAAGEDGEIELAEGDFSPEGCGECGLDFGAEVVCVEEKRDAEDNEKDKGNGAAEGDQEGAAGECHTEPLI